MRLLLGLLEGTRRGTRIALGVVVAYVLLAAFARWVAPQPVQDLRSLDLMNASLPRSGARREPARSSSGTDEQGRDVLSGVLFGLRLSMGVGFAAVALAMVIGLAAGLVSGYRGGWLDAFLMRTADAQLTFPAILVAMLLDGVARSVLPRSVHETLGIPVVVGAIALAQWVPVRPGRRAWGRSVEREKGYVQAAQVMARPWWSILLSHVLPNVMGPDRGHRHHRPGERHPHRGDAVLPRRGHPADVARRSGRWCGPGARTSLRARGGWWSSPGSRSLGWCWRSTWPATGCGTGWTRSSGARCREHLARGAQRLAAESGRRRPAGAGRVVPHRAGPGAGPGRRVRRREVAHRGRAHRAGRGAGPHRRRPADRGRARSSPRRCRRGPSAPRQGGGLRPPGPIHQPRPALSGGRPAGGDAPGASAAGPGGGARAGNPAAGRRGPPLAGRAVRALPAPALGRDAAARGHRARPVRRAAAGGGRRVHHRARRVDAGADRLAAGAAGGGARRLGAAHHPRPRRGRRARDRGGHHVRGAHRRAGAGGAAAPARRGTRTPRALLDAVPRIGGRRAAALPAIPGADAQARRASARMRVPPAVPARLGPLPERAAAAGGRPETPSWPCWHPLEAAGG